MKNIMCTECKELIGTVSMVPVDPINRPGINYTLCDPSPMPKKCPKCNGSLERKYITLEGV